MDARPSPEQRALADAAGRLAARLGPATVGDLDDLERRARLDAALAQAGWRELRTGSPSEPVASGVETAMVARALARRACDTAFIGPVLAHDLLRRVGATGDFALALAVDLHGVSMNNSSTLERPALAIEVEGTTAALLLASVEGGYSLVEASFGPIVDGVDLTRSIAPLVAGTAVRPVTGTGVLTGDDLIAWTALAVTLTAADLVGAMEGALALTIDYAKERRQFGAPIGSYQAVQHLLAEAKTLTEGSASTVIHAAWAVDALSPVEARAAAAVAKAYASRAARTVCETAIQVHGGIGNTWECMAHVFLRRTLLATELFGGDGPQLALLSSHRWGATNGLS